MKVLQPGFVRYALLVCAALTTACTSPGYNDNPSQQITNARVGCLAATEFFAVYFSVHVRPSNQNQDTRMRKELFRSYCNDIPTTGKVFFTADLVGDELKSVPIGIRIVEQESAVHDENLTDRRTIAEVPAKTYSKGVVEADFEIVRNGVYAVYLIRGGEGAVSEADNLRIPISVGVGTGALFSSTGIAKMFGIALGLALLGIVTFRYMRRDRVF